MRPFFKACIACLICCLSFSCQPEVSTQKNLFELLDGSKTGLTASNDLTLSLDLNVFNYMYFYNGGGVAIGDFNQDGQEDVFLTRNQSKNKLYLNKGALQFEDVSTQAGIGGNSNAWSTGCTTVDINQDGLLDIYVSQVSKFRELEGHNELWICQGIENGIPVFKEEAETYGLAFTGFCTQAAFFDYDLDGDLDMYQLRHSVHENGTFGKRVEMQEKSHESSGDMLLENVDGRFVDVTTPSGILSTVIGYGLGIAVSDINLDGWPDIYIANDFHENDYLYLNQQNGRFKETLNEQINHTSKFSMGVDIADINNDGYSEIFTLDMLPYDPYILKSSLGEEEYDVYHFKLSFGYNYQYARNNLQLNNGDNTFSEIGQLTGMHATDWSWSPLIFDFDHDGHKDFFISNGIPKRMNDIDYISFMSGADQNQKFKFNKAEQDDLSVAERMPEIKLPNKFFLNKGDLQFQDLKEQVQNNQPSYSNGAAYADFDGDGDLDILVNNIGDGPFIYRNLATENTDAQDYLSLQLQGPARNPSAIGARVLVYKSDSLLQFENHPVRAFQSSTSHNLHLGLGQASEVDSMLLIWPDQSYQYLQPDSFNAQIKLTWQEGLARYDYKRLRDRRSKRRFPLEEVSAEVDLQHVHKENDFVEFNRERLIPNMSSTEGPALAVGDVNGDGRDDLFIGSSKWGRSTVYVQNTSGKFELLKSDALIQDSVYEDVDAEWIDLDNDKDLDLVVASGGNEFWGKAFQLQPRVYLNDGSGQLSVLAGAFDSIYVNASCLAVHDVNQDGFPDLFLGGRSVPWNYGKSPESFLLLNKGDGRFEDQTERYAPSLKKAGMVKDAFWADMDQDADQDLVVSTEWGPIKIFESRGKRFVEHSPQQISGWWNALIPADFDGDGDVDFIAGNLGLNSKIKASPKHKVSLYLNDFDDNGKAEQLLEYRLGERDIVFNNYKELTMQMPSLKKKFLFAKDFAKADLEDLVGKEKLQQSEQLQAECLENSLFINEGELSFNRRALPTHLQFSPIKAGAYVDLDGDGGMELVLGGNFYESNISMGRYDADYGSILSFDKNGLVVKELESLGVRGQIRQIKVVQINGHPHVVLVRNNDSVLILRSDQLLQ